MQRQQGRQQLLPQQQALVAVLDGAIRRVEQIIEGRDRLDGLVEAGGQGRVELVGAAGTAAAVEDAVLPQEGQVGLIAMGPSAAQFDGLHVLDLVSNRTFSQPAAY